MFSLPNIIFINNINKSHEALNVIALIIHINIICNNI